MKNLFSSHSMFEQNTKFVFQNSGPKKLVPLRPDSHYREDGLLKDEHYYLKGEKEVNRTEDQRRIDEAQRLEKVNPQPAYSEVKQEFDRVANLVQTLEANDPGVKRRLIELPAQSKLRNTRVYCEVYNGSTSVSFHVKELTTDDQGHPLEKDIALYRLYKSTHDDTYGLNSEVETVIFGRQRKMTSPDWGVFAVKREAKFSQGERLGIESDLLGMDVYLDDAENAVREMHGNLKKAPEESARNTIAFDLRKRTQSLPFTNEVKNEVEKAINSIQGYENELANPRLSDDEKRFLQKLMKRQIEYVDGQIEKAR